MINNKFSCLYIEDNQNEEKIEKDLVMTEDPMSSKTNDKKI